MVDEVAVQLQISAAHLAAIAACFFFQAEDGIRDVAVTGVQTCALPIYSPHPRGPHSRRPVLRARRGLVTRPADHEIRDGALHAGKEPAIREPRDRCRGSPVASVRAARNRVVRITTSVIEWFR